MGENPSIVMVIIFELSIEMYLMVNIGRLFYNCFTRLQRQQQLNSC
jgi:hypothetical protein